MADKLTTEQIQEQAKQLGEANGLEIKPIAFETSDGQQIVGYIKEPDLIQTMQAIDAIMQSPTSAGESLLQNCLIREVSDERILSVKNEHKKIHIGAVMACLDLVSFYQDQLKKK